MAAIWYVSKDVGNDTWDGTAPTFQGGNVGPWATIAKAIGLAGVAQKEETVRIIKGATPYLEAVNIKAFGAAAESERVTIEGYETGAWPGLYMNPANRPVISALALAAEIFDLNGEDYVTVRDVVLDTADATYHGFYASQASYLIIRRCLVQGVTNGITASAGPTNYATIEDNEFTGITGDAITCGAGGCRGWTVKRNYIHDYNGDDGIQLQHQVAVSYLCQDHVVEDNRIINLDGATADAIVIQPCINCTIKGNFIDGVNTGIAAGAMQGGSIEDNFVRDTDVDGIRLQHMTVPVLTSGGYAIRRNMVFNVGGVSFYHGIKVTNQDATLGTAYIENNSVYGITNGQAFAIDFDLTYTIGNPVLVLRNNIGRNASAYGLRVRGTYVAGTPDVQNDYNDWYNNTSGTISDVNGWANSPEANGITSDPIQRDPANADMHLENGSPAIGTGDPASTSLHGGPSDIGAFEYGAPVGRRLRIGKYFRGSAGAVELLVLEGMER